MSCHSNLPSPSLVVCRFVPADQRTGIDVSDQIPIESLGPDSAALVGVLSRKSAKAVQPKANRGARKASYMERVQVRSERMLRLSVEESSLEVSRFVMKAYSAACDIRESTMCGLASVERLTSGQSDAENVLALLGPACDPEVQPLHTPEVNASRDRRPPCRFHRLSPTRCAHYLAQICRGGLGAPFYSFLPEGALTTGVYLLHLLFPQRR